MTENDYDIAIIGSGIAGSALGAILARHGQRVVIFEAQEHPRFTIGESLILETSEMMRALAHFYDLPELAYFSTENFLPFAGTTHGIKRHFGFLHHQAGQKQNPAHTLQAVIPSQPHGHELHLYRQDSDYFMMCTAVSYGATVLQNTAVADITIQPDRVTIFTADGEQTTANYVVDAGGVRSILAQKFNLRDFDLQTHSRGLFTHMLNVSGFEQATPKEAAYDLPFPMAEGTLHHLFAGGWLWVIPFNNHAAATNPLCSVGLLLDPRQHPQRDDLSAEEEFFTFISQFPAIAAQFTGAKAVRPWVRSGRIQYKSKQVVGERWALLGHAAGFVDPLFSKGLYSSFTAVFLLAHRLIDAQKTGDYSANAFADVEVVTRNFVCTADRLIANSYRSWQRYELWQVYAVQWLLGAYTELVKLNMMRAIAGDDRQQYDEQLVTMKLAGGGYTQFDGVADRVDRIMAGVDLTDDMAVTNAVSEIKQIFRSLDWIAEPFLALLDGDTYLPKNKLRLSLLRSESGFMGKGTYKRHFFGDLTMGDLLRYGAKEKLRYARPYLAHQHKQLYKKRAAF